MKAVLLAGRLGSRLTEESQVWPKPMVKPGGLPILRHVMKKYSHYGFYDFIICGDCRQNMIKEWFAGRRRSDVCFDFMGEQAQAVILKRCCESWHVSVISAGNASWMKWAQNA